MSELSYQGQTIQQRESDNYVSLTQMAKANSVRYVDWEENKQAKEYLKALDESIYANCGTNVRLIEVKGFGAEKTTWGHPLVAIAFAQWISPEFHVWCNTHIKTLMDTGKTELIDSLEKQFTAKVPLKEIDEFATIMGKRFGASYEQRLLTQNIKKFHPHFALPEPALEEKASLVAEALLTPTQLAENLNIFYATGNPNPRKVNELLEQLGYQIKISGAWSATDKAKDLCDRKPVDTNSKTQKDQLLWSAKIIDVLREHAI